MSFFSIIVLELTEIIGITFAIIVKVLVGE